MSKTLLFLLSLFVAAPFYGDAAEFRLESETATVGVGEEFLVALEIDGQGEPINAMEGKVAFPEDLLEFREIREKGSIVNLWVEQPELRNGAISFSGLTPGGYREDGVLFSVLFAAKEEGQGVIAMEEGGAFLHDGKGTKAELSMTNFQFSIRQPTDGAGQAPVSATDDVDVEPPEPFAPRVAEDASVFEGQPFLVFAAQDKNAGISRYEVSFVRNGDQGAWQKAKSPFLLLQYSEIDEIFVKAVDRAGNERIANLSLGNPFLNFFLYGNIGILVAIGTVLIFWLWRRKRKGYHEH